MRWFGIRRAEISPDLREAFERYGVNGMQVALSTSGWFHHGRKVTPARDHCLELLPWLTEQYDRAERRETWLITMEASITVFVLAELILAAVQLYHGH